MSDLAIRVDGLGKQYKIGSKQERYRTIRDTLSEAALSPFRRVKGVIHGELYSASGLSETIWALRNVSFEINHGEVVGIIGRNGAGKSTLLKILSEITEPTEGTVDLYGRVGSLLEVGTGFHPELTGRENIYLNGAILGMTRVEIDYKFDEIVDFAEVEKFIDTPVKHYSSGMGLRLGFAVAAHLEPDILVVDEVLAVGDAAFQKKCLGKMGDAAREGRTVLFVSHNMGAIARLCPRTILLDQGIKNSDGRTENIISQYLSSGASVSGEYQWVNGYANPGINDFNIFGVCIKNEAGETSSILDARKEFYLEIEYEIFEQLPYCRIGFIVSNVEGVILFSSYDAEMEKFTGVREPGTFTSRCKVPGYLLAPGHYVISINVGIPNVRNLAKIDDILSFDIENTRDANLQMGNIRKENGVIQPKLDWMQEKR